MKRYSSEEIYPKNQLGKCMIYFNMSHHYRRIYSAKPRIDTNLRKKPEPQFCCSSPDVFNFVRRNCLKQPVVHTPRHRFCLKEEEPPKPFKPKILDYKAESKLRSLPVYQPPKKIFLPKAKKVENVVENVNETHLDGDKKVIEEKKVPKPNVFFETEYQPEHIDGKEESEPKQKPIEGNGEEGPRYRPLDKSTVMFLKDITDDILRKGIYTNKSLEKLFNHHIEKNKYLLPKDLMRREVTRLKVELEMPLEEEKDTQISSTEDEEVLTALDSLLLPAGIRDQVASSLGLKRKPPPLPSPKDSFTGSLALTSMSDSPAKNELKDPNGTYTLKLEKDTQENGRNDTLGHRKNSSEVMDDKETEGSDDETIGVEDYPEEESSDVPEVNEMSIKDQGVKIKERSDHSEIQTEDKSSPTVIESEVNSIVSDNKSEVSSNISDVKSETMKSSKSMNNNNNENEGSQTSESESIHTEPE